MPPNLERRRVLLAAEAAERDLLRLLFTGGPIAGWEAVEADSFERARFILQMDPCDVLLVDVSLYRKGDAEGLAWLTEQHRAAVLFLADQDPDVLLDALRHGARQWLPRGLALERPEVLAACLRQVAEIGELQHRADVAGEALQDSQRQVSRLVSLLWEATPGEGRAHWFTQRHMMERLEEELARTQRYGGPLTIVLGEAHGPQGERLPPEEWQQAATWTADQVSRVKRRCDVAGQYGPHGLMLLLPRVTDREAAACCRRLQALLESAPPNAAHRLPALRTCFGIASYSPAAATLKSLLSRAEARLEQARSSPGDRVAL